MAQTRGRRGELLFRWLECWSLAHRCELLHLMPKKSGRQATNGHDKFRSKGILERNWPQKLTRGTTVILTQGHESRKGGAGRAGAGLTPHGENLSSRIALDPHGDPPPHRNNCSHLRISCQWIKRLARVCKFTKSLVAMDTVWSVKDSVVLLPGRGEGVKCHATGWTLQKF